MRVMGVVLCLVAIAALLGTVSKAEGHRHDQQACECWAGADALSSEATPVLDCQLAVTDNYEQGLTRNTDAFDGDLVLWLGSLRAVRPTQGDWSSEAVAYFHRKSGPVVLGVGV